MCPARVAGGRETPGATFLWFVSLDEQRNEQEVIFFLAGTMSQAKA
jgi:hypothetical protein